MSAGRPPERTKLVEKAEGSEEAKRRLRLILETLSGERTVQSACDELEICQAMFYKLRTRFLQESVESLERRKPCSTTLNTHIHVHLCQRFRSLIQNLSAVRKLKCLKAIYLRQ